MLQNAESFLANNGINLPEGWSVEWGSGPNHRADPNDSTIYISEDAILAQSPNLEGDVTSYGGILVVALYHEIQHANGSFGADPETCDGKCQEVVLQHQIAEKHREFIAHILDVLPGADVTPLCTYYNDIRECYNNGCRTEDGASGDVDACNCEGGYPGDIEPAPGC